jgi:hypothetical protein
VKCFVYSTIHPFRHSFVDIFTWIWIRFRHPVVLGGGFHLGQSCALLCDSPVGYGRNFLRYFASEGIARKDRVVLVSSRVDVDGKNVLLFDVSEYWGSMSEEDQKLYTSFDPKTKEPPSSSSSGKRTVASQDDLKIAWQYEKYRKRASAKQTAATVECHSYDLSRPMQTDLVGKSPPIVIDPLEFRDQEDLLKEILRVLSASKTTAEPTSPIGRIVIDDLLSAAWPVLGDSADLSLVTRFMLSLKSLTRRMNIATLFTVSKDHPRLGSILRYCDSVFRFQSFAHVSGDVSASSQIGLEGFEGTFVCERLSDVNSMRFPVPKCAVYLVKVRHRRMFLEEPNIPPAAAEGEDASSKSKEEKTDMSF